LDKLDAPILNVMFTYLDALDILNVAQINMSMYSRVDSLFGFGDSKPEMEDSSTIATNETPIDAKPSHPPPVEPQVLPPQATVASLPTTASIPEPKPAGSAVQSPQPTVVALPPLSPKPPPLPTNATQASAKPTVASINTAAGATETSRQAADTTTATIAAKPSHASTNSADASISRGIFSLLQPRRPTGAASPATTPPRTHQARKQAPAIPGTHSVDGTGGTEQPVPLNAAMANSMAAKLSDTELHAIFQMTERLKQKESLAARLAKEKEELAAKLDGTEGVKQFLIAKVRDMEASLNGFVDNEIKVALQIASDQEVIAFLDGRVQELEREARTLQNEKQVALDTLERVQRQSNQKATVLGDMLQFEREKLSDQEREWKATKKLLVKEVKHCRAQIVALQAERDGYREQNETLRRAIMTNSSIANGSSNSGNVAGSKQYVRDRTLA
jgi:hypothetical protein